MPTGADDVTDFDSTLTNLFTLSGSDSDGILAGRFLIGFALMMSPSAV
jgi:hypothetical protein